MMVAAGGPYHAPWPTSAAQRCASTSARSSDASRLTDLSNPGISPARPPLLALGFTGIGRKVIKHLLHAFIEILDVLL